MKQKKLFNTSAEKEIVNFQYHRCRICQQHLAMQLYRLHGERRDGMFTLSLAGLQQFADSRNIVRADRKTRMEQDLAEVSEEVLRAQGEADVANARLSRLQKEQRGLQAAALDIMDGKRNTCAGAYSRSPVKPFWPRCKLTRVGAIR